MIETLEFIILVPIVHCYNDFRRLLHLYYSRVSMALFEGAIRDLTILLKGM